MLLPTQKQRLKKGPASRGTPGELFVLRKVELGAAITGSGPSHGAGRAAQGVLDPPEEVTAPLADVFGHTYPFP